jgi:serine/threonine protein kinase
MTTNPESTHSTKSDFDFGARLGKGSFGEVFAAKRRKDGKTYVIKMIRIAELSQKEQRAAVNEVHVMASLSSPFVVRYFDSFIEDGLLHFIFVLVSPWFLKRYKFLEVTTRTRIGSWLA